MMMDGRSLFGLELSSNRKEKKALIKQNNIGVVR